MELKLDSMSMTVAFAIGATVAFMTDALGDRRENPQVRRLLALVPMVLGAALGAIPGLLPGDTMAQRIVGGIVAGSLASKVYDAVTRRP